MVWEGRRSSPTRFAAEHGREIKVFDGITTARELRTLIASWHPPGCLVEASFLGPNLSVADFSGVPTVFQGLDPKREGKGLFLVQQDPAAVANLAAEELFALGYRDCAYIGTPERYFWDTARRDVFARAAKAAKRRFHEFGPDGITRRGSTARHYADVRVNAALAYIREHCCEDIGVPEVAAAMKCGRRFAERHFREATGQSVLEAIRAERLERVFRLLRNPRQDLGAIPALCGYSSSAYLKTYFKRVTGLSMGAWRKQAKGAAPRVSAGRIHHGSH